MLVPLEVRAASLSSSSGAPAVLIEASSGGRNASTALGVDDLATGVTASSDQSFEVGSQTKIVTAVVVLQLADERLIDLDAPVANWLPASVIDGLPNADVATVRQLLAMRSGIANYTEALDGCTVPRPRGPGVGNQHRACRDHPDKVQVCPAREKHPKA